MNDDNKDWWKPLFRDRRRLEGAEADLAMAAYTGLLQGNLLPFAAFMKAGYDLHPLLRKQLVAMIESDPAAEFTISAKKVRRGPGSFVSRHRDRAKRLRVAQFVREHEQASGQRESAVHEAMEKFQVGRAYVFDALHEAKKWDRAFTIDFEPLARAIESMKFEESDDP